MCLDVFEGNLGKGKLVGPMSIAISVTVHEAYMAYSKVNELNGHVLLEAYFRN